MNLFDNKGGKPRLEAGNFCYLTIFSCWQRDGPCLPGENFSFSSLSRRDIKKNSSRQIRYVLAQTGWALEGRFIDSKSRKKLAKFNIA